MKNKKKVDYQSAYNSGVKDSLRILYTHITSVEHGTGFAASQRATDYVDMMKHVYDTIGTLHK